MQVIETKVYTYDELSDKAKEKAREWYQEGNDYPFLSEYMEEQGRELLEAEGFTNITIDGVYYSLAYCQGDGAMMEFSAERNGLYIKVKQSGHYNHERSTSITVTNEEGEELESEEIEEDILVPLFKELATQGYNYIDAENEEEYIAENIRANDYTFTESGTRFG